MNKNDRGFLMDNLGFSYGSYNCLQDISLRLESGHFYGLIGPNGSGKSTLLSLMSGHLVQDNGSILLHGTEVHNYSRKALSRLLTTVPQSFSLNFDFSVHEVVLMGRHPHIARFANPDRTDFAHVDNALDLMGISHLQQRTVTQLSGGEKQRVMVARSLAQNTEIILLDEVTSNLDINYSISIMKTMSKMVREEGRTVIAALHDLNMAAAFCDRLIVLQDGGLSQFGDTSEIISEELILDLYQVPSKLSSDNNGKNHIRFTYQ